MKSAAAFRTISEVADELGVPKHVLRFWEMRFPQIKPMKRGGGRRYYRPADVELLKGIRHLLHAEGYTIKGVQKILRDQGLEGVQRCWRPDAGAAVARVQAAPAAEPTPLRPVPSRPIAVAPASRAAASPSERAAVVRRIIAELEACRDRLAALVAQGVAEPAKTAPKSRATKPLRARGAR